MRKLFSLVLAMILIGVFAPMVVAETTLGVSPLKLEYQINPGENTTKTVNVFNPGKDSLDVVTEVTDFRVNEKGVPVFVTPESGPFSAGNWLDVSPGGFTLKPGEQKDVQVRLKVPQEASPGGHYGAILFKFSSPITAGGQIGVGVSGRIAVVNIISLPGVVKQEGTLEKLAIPLFNSAYPVAMNLSVANSGNVHLKLDGVLEITNWLGQHVDTVSIPEGYVFPNSTKTVKLSMDKGAMFGFYKASVHLNDKSIVSRIRPQIFIVFPWALVLGILLATYGIFKLGMTRGRKTS